MALDLGHPLILCLCRHAGCPQIAHPAGGMAHYLQDTALKASARAPFGAARACRKPGLAERRFDVRLRPGTPGGLGAFAVAGTLSQGDTCLHTATSCPSGQAFVRLLGGVAFAQAFVGPHLRWRLISVVP